MKPFLLSLTMIQEVSPPVGIAPVCSAVSRPSPTDTNQEAHIQRQASGTAAGGGLHCPC
jgi:hypothetical protein